MTTPINKTLRDRVLSTWAAGLPEDTKIAFEGFLVGREAEISVSFADSRETITIHLDEVTARALGERLLEITRSDAQVEPISLPRAGLRSLKLRGRLVAESTSESPNSKSPLSNRWHEIRLYRLDSGQFAVSITYHSRWEGETQGWSGAAVLGDLVEVERYLGEFDPNSTVRGFPPGEAYRVKAAALARDIQDGWNAAVSTLWSQVD